MTSQVPALGFGAMGLSAFYPPLLEDEESRLVLKKVSLTYSLE